MNFIHLSSPLVTLFCTPPLAQALERQKEYTDAVRLERDELREEVVKLKDVLKVPPRGFSPQTTFGSGALTFASSVQKHGIVLGPDLSVNGDAGEAEVDETPGAEPESRSAPNPQTSPAEGNSMLGKKPPCPHAARLRRALRGETLHRPVGASLHSFQRTFDFWSRPFGSQLLELTQGVLTFYADNLGDPLYFSQN